MFTQNFKFSTCSPLFIPVHFTCRMLMNFFEWKIEEWKERKELFFCKLNIIDGNIFYTHTDTHTHIYIYTHKYIYIYIYNIQDNKNINIYMFIYKQKVLKIVCAFLIKVSATTKQLIRKNSVCCLTPENCILEALWKQMLVYFCVSN